MVRPLALLSFVLFSVALVAHVWAEPSGNKSARIFQGYWMGVDPVDGGDSRRSLVLQDNGTYALAGRDSALTLCDGTDRGFASFEDGEVVGKNVLQSDTLNLRCFNNNASVVLHVRYQLIRDGLMVEDTQREDGTPVSTIVFHKVSQD